MVFINIIEGLLKMVYGKVTEQSMCLTSIDGGTKDYLVSQRRHEKSRSMMIVCN